MEAILRQCLVPCGPDSSLTSDEFSKICRFVDGLSVAKPPPAVSTAAVETPRTSPASTPVIDTAGPAAMDLEEGEEECCGMDVEPLAPIPVAGTDISINGGNDIPTGPRKYRKITVAELVAAGGDPEVLEDVFSEYVDEDVEDMDEDVLENLFLSGFLVVVTAESGPSPDEEDECVEAASDGVAMETVTVHDAVVVDTKAQQQQLVNKPGREVGIEGANKEVTSSNDSTCSLCGYSDHRLENCKYAKKVEKKAGTRYEMDFNTIRKLSKDDVEKLRDSCRSNGRIKNPLFPQESGILEKCFSDVLSPGNGSNRRDHQGQRGGNSNNNNREGSTYHRRVTIQHR